MPLTFELNSSRAGAPRYSIANTYRNPSSLSYRFRARRFEHLKPLIEGIIARKGVCRIADIGGTEYYWDIFGSYVHERPIEVDLINLELQPTRSSRFQSLIGDATALGHVDDNAYDLVHSNSVIEHVGSWSSMSSMAGHVRRLAPAYFLQTPNFWFPYEPHFRVPFFHWLPEQVRCSLLLSFNLGFGGRRANLDEAMRGAQSASLLSMTQLSHLFPDAKIVRERVAGLTKSLMAVREAQ